MTEFHANPPYGNTGVENTERKPLIALVDWVEATFPNEKNVTKIIEILGLNEADFYELADGMNGYKLRRIYGNISILSEPSEKYSAERQAQMGIHISLSGQGCREYELLGAKTWQTLFKDIKAAGGHFSRLDVAIDDIRYNGDKPYFTVKQLLKKKDNKEMRSKFKKGRDMTEWEIASGENLGKTMYIGMPKSSLMFRIYEKHYERLAAGKELDENLTCWNRFELQLRDERAQKMADYIMDVEDIGLIILGVINQYVAFVDPDPNDTNRARWKKSKFWNNFLQGVGKLPLTNVAPDKTIETRKEWIEEATPRTLAMLHHAGELSESKIQEMILEGTELLKEKDWNEIELHRLKKRKQSENLKSISVDQLELIKYDLMSPVMTQNDYKLVTRINEKLLRINKKPLEHESKEAPRANGI